MRIGVYEYVTAELLGDSAVPMSLRTEGQAMLSAVAADFSRIAGVEVVPFTSPCMPERFRELVQQVDYTLVIAPEFDDLLYTRCRWVEEAGGRLLGPAPDAVRLTADKLLLSVYLRKRGVRTPPCGTSLPGEALRPDQLPLMWKPRFGAGSQATYVLHSPPRPGVDAAWSGEMVLQPYISGLAVSVAFLVGPAGVVPLRPASQSFSAEHVAPGVSRLHYEGGMVPLSQPLAERAVRCAQPAVAAVAGLRGWVGVDVVLGEATDGSEDQVIEINPRLTTSYVGLRVLAVTNLAEAMLHVVEGERAVAVQWRSGVVQFTAEGTAEAAATAEAQLASPWS